MKKTSSILFALTLGIGAVWGQDNIDLLDRIDVNFTDISSRKISGGDYILSIQAFDASNNTLNVPLNVEAVEMDTERPGFSKSTDIATTYQDENGIWHLSVNEGKQGSMIVYVYQPTYWWYDFWMPITIEQPVDSVSITPNPSTLTIAKGDEVTFTVTTYPATASYPKMRLDGLGPEGFLELVGEPSYSGSNDGTMTFTVKALETRFSSGFSIRGDQNFFIKSCYFPIVEEGIITGVVPVSERSRTVACYNLLGKKLPKTPDSGIYIIVYDNGKVEKVVK
ncbi:MAG: hypothetical protein LBN27_12395 [Prevotellaceae bacterium]|jgi:hypothetical protein|nr:hypothetical protein [Prevotellaceae bacterium]